MFFQRQIEQYWKFVHKYLSKFHLYIFIQFAIKDIFKNKHYFRTISSLLKRHRLTSHRAAKFSHNGGRFPLRGITRDPIKFSFMIFIYALPGEIKRERG